MTSDLYDTSSSIEKSKIVNNRKITTESKMERKSLGDLRQNLINRRKSPLKNTTGSKESAELATKKRTISLTEMLREEQEISGKIFKKALTETETLKKDDKKITVKRDQKERSEKREVIPSHIHDNKAILRIFEIPGGGVTKH